MIVSRLLLMMASKEPSRGTGGMFSVVLSGVSQELLISWAEAGAV